MDGWADGADVAKSVLISPPARFGVRRLQLQMRWASEKASVCEADGHVFLAAYDNIDNSKNCEEWCYVNGNHHDCYMKVNRHDYIVHSNGNAEKPSQWRVQTFFRTNLTICNDCFSGWMQVFLAAYDNIGKYKQWGMMLYLWQSSWLLYLKNEITL